MIVYFIFFLIILILRCVCKKDKVFSCLTGVMLWGLLACRSIEVGLYDTKAVYYSAFNMLTEMSFFEIIKYRWMDDKIFYFLMKIIP